MRRVAFTLIELIISVTIIILLIAVGLPRFNDYNLRQNVSGAAQQLAGCIQQAQQEALAPPTNATGKSIGYTVAQIIFINGSITCQTKAYTRAATFDANGTASPVTALVASSQPLTLDSMVPCQATFSYTDSSNAPHTIQTLSNFMSGITIQFGVLEGGAPVGVYSSSNLAASLLPAFGTGVEMTRLLIAPYTGDADAACTDPNLYSTINPDPSATLRMGRLGVPIQLQ